MDAAETILLIGGNAEADRIARELLASGRRVVLTTATALAPGVSPGEGLEILQGRLDRDGIAALIRSRRASAVVNAAHPYAALVRRIAPEAAAETGTPYFSFLRPETPLGDDPHIHVADTHAGAAAKAFAFGMPVLLTTGIRNLRPYADEAARSGLPLTVRVLPEKASVDACLAAGLPEERIIAAKGPFSLGENRRHIRMSGAGTLVTKDGGAAGGVAEKLAAARMERCETVLVRRPPEGGRRYCTIGELMAALDGMAAGHA